MGNFLPALTPRHGMRPTNDGRGGKKRANVTTSRANSHTGSAHDVVSPLPRLCPKSPMWEAVQCGRRLRRRFRPVPQPTCEVPAVIAVRDRSQMSFLSKAPVPLIASNKLQALGPGIVGTETDRMVCCGVVPARRVILSRPKQRQQSETSIVLSRHLSSQLLIFGCLTEKQIRPRHNVAE